MHVPDFKLSLCSECCVLYSRLFTGVCIVSANVSEHALCSIFIGEYEVRLGAVNVVFIREKVWLEKLPEPLMHTLFRKIVPKTVNVIYIIKYNTLLSDGNL
jgi:hypothetical protein